MMKYTQIKISDKPIDEVSMKDIDVKKTVVNCRIKNVEEN